MDNPKKPLNFIEQVNLQLNNYSLQKILQLETQQPHNPQQSQAKQTLIELDDETDNNSNEEDAGVGRWSHYRTSQTIDEKIQMQQLRKRSNTAYRYPEEQNRPYLPSLCRSEKTIPKLKVILHQLECPLNLTPDRKIKTFNSTSKLKNHLGMEALVISNKQQIKPTIKTERKATHSIHTPDNSENKRPPSSQFKGQTASSTYQKIKRSIGSPQDHEFICEKQILSQLLKSNPAKQQNSVLTNMLNYFTKTNNDPKRKVSVKLGLDKLLS